MKALYGLEDGLKKLLRNYAFLFGIAGLIIVLDQLSKSYVRANLPLGGYWAPWDWMMPYARFVHILNTGVAFGMFQNYGMIFGVLALCIAAAIIFYFPRVPEKEWLLRLALAMQLAGAVGNLIDRVLNNGAVTDFISVGRFAVFNVADASITVGVGVMLLAALLQERREKAAKNADARLADVLVAANSPEAGGKTGVEGGDR